MIYEPGKRYPLTLQDALFVLKQAWPVVEGEPDLTRGRRFLAAPAKWEFWLSSGHKVDFEAGAFGVIVSQSKEPDPERPEPME